MGSLAAVDGVGAPEAAPQTPPPTTHHHPRGTPGVQFGKCHQDCEVTTLLVVPSPLTSGSSTHLVLAEPQGRAL